MADETVNEMSDKAKTYYAMLAAVFAFLTPVAFAFSIWLGGLFLLIVLLVLLPFGGGLMR